MKVYLLQQHTGQYEDAYSLEIGIFSSRDSALACVPNVVLYEDDDLLTIHEHELDKVERSVPEVWRSKPVYRPGPALPPDPSFMVRKDATELNYCLHDGKVFCSGGPVRWLDSHSLANSDHTTLEEAYDARIAEGYVEVSRSSSFLYKETA